MKKTLNKILMDLVNHMNEEKDTNPSKDYYKYDRPKFITRFEQPNDENIYDSDLESLNTMINQINLFGHIIFTDQDGKDIRNNRIIKEKTK